jgi:hypothetical protein
MGGIGMSHFTVGVIVRKPEDLIDALAPYCEQDENYMIREVNWTREDYIKYHRLDYPTLDQTDDEIWAEARESYGLENSDEENIYGYYNPNARWDWWSIGGRWRYRLKVLKTAEHIKDQDMFFGGEPKKQRGKYRWCDGAKIKDIRWADMNHVSREQMKCSARFWDVVVDGAEPAPDENFGFHWRGEYYRELYGTKENFIMKDNLFHTHDLLDGITNEWYTSGDMGWFGCDAATGDSLNDYLQDFYEIIQRPEYQDYWFIMVDCHI